MRCVITSCFIVLFCSAVVAQDAAAQSDQSGLAGADKPPVQAVATPRHPEGTLSRPQDSVRHPILDRAWEKHDAVAAKAAERIGAAIDEQFDDATDQADLDAALKWQAVKKKFEQTGELPDDTRTEAAVIPAIAAYWEAKDELAKVYEAVIKDLTREQEIAAAQAVRKELRTQQASKCDPIKLRDLRKEFEAIEDRGGWAWREGNSRDGQKRSGWNLNEPPFYRVNKDLREFTHLVRERGELVRLQKYSPTYEIKGVEDQNEDIVLIKMVYPLDPLARTKQREEATFRFNRKTGEIDSPFNYFGMPVKPLKSR